MIFLMYWEDPKDHILKVSCHYLYFWLKYKGLYSKWVTCRREREEREERREKREKREERREKREERREKREERLEKR